MYNIQESKCERFLNSQNLSKRLVSSLRCSSFPGRIHEPFMKGVCPLMHDRSKRRNLARNREETHSWRLGQVKNALVVEVVTY